MIYKNTYCTFLTRLFLTTGLVVYVFFINAQISPGKLSKAHSSLEGINQCTKCHELGAKVSDQKCLSCHEPLKVRIQQKKGYHASKEVTGKSCVTCHSEHHGVNFEMVRFDKKTFNHTLTGYELKGKHKTNDCAKCHRPEHISDPKLKLNKSTFLGLNPSCISCHDDYHKKTLDKDCKKCHDYEAFKPAPFFNHDKTGFPLAGAHKTVDCKLCHKVETTNGKTFQHFANVPFKNCNACHVDPHKGKFGVDCKSCHTVESFHKIKASSTFNHSITGFELEGKHKVIDCKKCHDNRAGTTDAYKEFSSVRDISCLTCHKDSHENKFGNDCSSCHSQWNFSVKDKLNDFDHKLTGYELSGKHEAVDCRKCHKETFMTAPLPHDACKKCHEDFHKGEFKDTPYTDCASCHTTTGFDLSSFDWEQHEKSAFPLKGAHLATPCISCHKTDDQWKFRNIGNTCVSCHDNIHEGFISEKYIPANDCAACHNQDVWTSLTFDHNTTGFALEGKHLGISCRSCHFEENEKGEIIQKFIALDKNCMACHDNVHGQQFEENGITDCKRCHGFNTWDNSQFNHDNTRFKLEGAHLKVACEACHPNEISGGQTIVKYKTGKLLCIDCHQ